MQVAFLSVGVPHALFSALARSNFWWPAKCRVANVSAVSILSFPSASSSSSEIFAYFSDKYFQNVYQGRACGASCIWYICMPHVATHCRRCWHHRHAWWSAYIMGYIQPSRTNNWPMKTLPWVAVCPLQSPLMLVCTFSSLPLSLSCQLGRLVGGCQFQAKFG